LLPICFRNQRPHIRQLPNNRHFFAYPAAYSQCITNGVSIVLQKKRSRIKRGPMLKIQRSANEDRLLNNAIIIRADLLQIVTERWRMSGTGARKIPRGQLVCREHCQIRWRVGKRQNPWSTRTSPQGGNGTGRGRPVAGPALGRCDDRAQRSLMVVLNAVAGRNGPLASFCTQRSLPGASMIDSTMHAKIKTPRHHTSHIATPQLPYLSNARPLP
jgi:hypothetical protein